MWAVSRALASMPVLAELCLPYVKPGGLFLAMKSNKTDEEIDAARAIIQTLGGEDPFVMDYLLPETEIYHRVVTVFKSRPTPKAYPGSGARSRKQKFSIFAQKTIARHGAVWYNEAEDSEEWLMGSVIVITSGKGRHRKDLPHRRGGASLALLGKQVLCLDGDVGLRNLDITWA